MEANTEISRVTIVGSGPVGGSWAACFLAHGLDVVATDPVPGTEDKLRHYVEAAWPALTKIGLAPGASTSRLRFESDLNEALADAQMVQENAPERELLKIKLLADMDSVLPPPAILVSSTSGIPMSSIQSECKHPERCVTGHPFNPPHLIPFVEVVGGAKTYAETIERAMRFYTAMGKRPLHIRKEIPGHVANRLQGALYREVAYLIDQDVDGVADVDAAVCMGPGLRWALMGPNLIYHLGGGPRRAERVKSPHPAWLAKGRATRRLDQGRLLRAAWPGSTPRIKYRAKFDGKEFAMSQFSFPWSAPCCKT
jgi:carnitine 3-dehydrogenase